MGPKGVQSRGASLYFIVACMHWARQQVGMCSLSHMTIQLVTIFLSSQVAQQQWHSTYLDIINVHEGAPQLMAS